MKQEKKATKDDQINWITKKAATATTVFRRSVRVNTLSGKIDSDGTDDVDTIEITYIWLRWLTGRVTLNTHLI